MFAPDLPKPEVLVDRITYQTNGCRSNITVISRGGGGSQDIIIVQAMSDWPNDIISTAPVSLTVG